MVKVNVSRTTQNQREEEGEYMSQKMVEEVELAESLRERRECLMGEVWWFRLNENCLHVYATVCLGHVCCHWNQREKGSQMLSLPTKTHGTQSMHIKRNERNPSVSLK